MDGAREGDARSELVHGLARACSRHFGRAVRIDGLFRHSGGASRQTWGFDAIFDDGTVLKLVLRRDPHRTTEMARAGPRQPVHEFTARVAFACAVHPRFPVSRAS